MNTKIETSSELADVQVRFIAKQIIAGQLNENEGRWRIAAALSTVGIAENVAATTANLDPQLRSDLADRLHNLIEKKALQVEPGGLDLHRVLESSASGWARQLAKTARMSALRDIRLISRRMVVVDPTVDLNSDDTLGYAAAAFHLGGTEDSELGVSEAEADLMSIEDEFSAAAAGRRASGKLRLSAKALTNAYDLPAIIRPEHSLDREYIRDVVNEEGSIARAAAAALHALIVGTQTPAQAEIDERLLSLFDDFNVEQLELISTKPVDVAKTLVLSAISLVPRPSRDTLGLVLKTLRMADSDAGSPKEYQQFTRQLLDSWLAIEAEATSAFDNRSGAVNEARDAQRMADALAWPELSAKAVAREGQPFGKNEKAVSNFILSLLTDIS